MKSGADAECHAEPAIVSCCFADFLTIVSKPKKRRAGGEGGVVAEFVQCLPVEPKSMLHQLLHDTLTGYLAPPKHWKQAAVSLNPESLGAFLAGDFRPITVLSTALKPAAKMWLYAATPCIALQSPRSHGFRPGFQAAEIHRLVREPTAKHAEWGVPFTVIELDASKAYDTRVPSERRLICLPTDAIKHAQGVLGPPCRTQATPPHRGCDHILRLGSKSGDSTKLS